MDDDREAYEFSYALYLARQVDRQAAQMIVEAAEAGMRNLETRRPVAVDTRVSALGKSGHSRVHISR